MIYSFQGWRLTILLVIESIGKVKRVLINCHNNTHKDIIFLSFLAAMRMEGVCPLVANDRF
jgi:hypothetical protein